MTVTHVAAAVLLREDGSYLLGQRAADTFYPGFWEFPGGKVEPGEAPRDALIRELREELGIEVVQCFPWIVREHEYEHAHVRLHFFRVTKWQGELQDHVHAALSWQTIGAKSVAPMLPANGPVLKALTLPDFYAITQAARIGADAQLAALEQALKHGLRLVQIRERDMPEPQRTAFASEAVRLIQGFGARALINGDADMALELGADGIHLSARELMALTQRPEFKLVGASCHTRGELDQAIALGLDFAVVGSVNATPTHGMQEGIGWEAFNIIIADCPIPVFAIGGLQRDNMLAAWRHGAHGIAAIRSAWAVDSF
ncbi:Mutator mutT protein (7,8-dihydro-8-oxoguanine-triphosphatase) / Thiamin-phosphate pyrophosphorylase-like protein [Georgfuchsia toluolica]|uniref:8-oxo-dGTP diphosphatase n=1 Tax=Georgfuchsia toluolica TaxID=424218 RepID=A0A916J6C7_9PROT|nr:Nudix family hydrolase [Georgfuchsia toluolica]CAG4885061.1 Mutator mutT protein (7,8-dihydro-8-oxoguanine-triphosphatase) / Thiamin-phosphate pyrophosphorylase-like protein [Georgfuchsia toluolica]